MAIVSLARPLTRARDGCPLDLAPAAASARDAIVPFGAVAAAVLSNIHSNNQREARCVVVMAAGGHALLSIQQRSKYHTYHFLLPTYLGHSKSLFDFALSLADRNEEFIKEPVQCDRPFLSLAQAVRPF